MSGATFLVVATFEILWFAKSAYELRSEEYALWEVRDEVDEWLRGIREAFARIQADSHGGADLFVAHFQRALSDLTLQIGRAAHERELRVWSHHFGSVRNVMSVFAGVEYPTYWCTWPIGSGERLFEDSHWKSYFTQIIGMVESGNIKSVKTLLVVEDWEQLNERRVRSLAGFYGAIRGMEFAVVAKAEYLQFRRDAELPPGDVDFGIYGTRLLFRTESEAEKAGVFCKDQGLIRRYRNFFDTIWEHPDTRKDVARCDAVDTLARLMEIDAEAEN